MTTNVTRLPHHWHGCSPRAPNLNHTPCKPFTHTATVPTAMSCIATPLKNPALSCEGDSEVTRMQNESTRPRPRAEGVCRRPGGGGMGYSTSSALPIPQEQVKKVYWRCGLGLGCMPAQWGLPTHPKASTAFRNTPVTSVTSPTTDTGPCHRAVRVARPLPARTTNCVKCIIQRKQ